MYLHVHVYVQWKPPYKGHTIGTRHSVRYIEIVLMYIYRLYHPYIVYRLYHIKEIYTALGIHTCTYIYIYMYCILYIPVNSFDVMMTWYKYIYTWYIYTCTCTCIQLLIDTAVFIISSHVVVMLEKTTASSGKSYSKKFKNPLIVLVKINH